MTNLTAIGMTRLGSKPKSIAPEADALTTRPSEPLLNFVVQLVVLYCNSQQACITHYFLSLGVGVYFQTRILICSKLETYSQNTAISLIYCNLLPRNFPWTKRMTNSTPGKQTRKRFNQVQVRVF